MKEIHQLIDLLEDYMLNATADVILHKNLAQYEYEAHYAMDRINDLIANKSTMLYQITLFVNINEGFQSLLRLIQQEREMERSQQHLPGR